MSFRGISGKSHLGNGRSVNCRGTHIYMPDLSEHLVYINADLGFQLCAVKGG
jgi:hypothetical protein